MAAFQPSQGGIQWLEPMQEEAIRLIGEAQPRANVPPVEGKDHVTRALASLEEAGWYEKLVDHRVQALKESHARLRTVVGAKPLEVIPHTPPDILGLYVLVPSGGGR